MRPPSRAVINHSHVRQFLTQANESVACVQAVETGRPVHGWSEPYNALGGVRQRSENPFGLGSIANPHLSFTTRSLGVAGRIDGVKERLLFIEVITVHGIVEPHHPPGASAVLTDLKLHDLNSLVGHFFAFALGLSAFDLKTRDAV